MRVDVTEGFEPFLLPEEGSLGQVATLCSPENGAALWAGVWTCEPREWTSPFDADEVFLVLAGNAEVEIEDERVLLNPGNAYQFSKGEIGTWTVRDELRAFVVVC
jgi:uncharacterized cupin superfamily protein